MTKPALLTRNRIIQGGLVLLVLMGLYGLSRQNYLLFHSLIELFSVAMAWAIFMLFWNSHLVHDQGYYQQVGSGFLWVGLVDLLHTLTFSGMGVFPGSGTNLAVQLWLTARFLSVGVWLTAPFLVDRKLPVYWTLAVGAVLTSGMLAMIGAGWFPAGYVDGQGLTRFKVAGEWVVMAGLAVAMGLHWRRRVAFAPRTFGYLMVSIGLTIVQEAAFTLYVDVFGFTNALGHLLKLIASYLAYKAFVEVILWANHKKMEVLFDLLPVGIAIFDRQRRLVRQNTTIRHLLEGSGIPASQRFLHEDGTPMPVEELVHNRIFNGEAQALEAETGVIKADGQVAWISVSAQACDFPDWGVLAVTHETTQHRNEVSLQTAQFIVTRLLMEANSLPEVADELVQALAENLGWEVGELWQRPAAGLALQWVGGWHASDPGLAEFATVSRTFVYPRGQNVIEQVNQTGLPIWLEDNDSPGLPRVRAGLRTVVAFPIRGEGQPRGVIVLYGRTQRSALADLMLAFASVGRQIDLFLARREAEAALEEERNSLALRVEERTADLRQANLELARAAHLKDEFLSSMSHELRTPLNGILGVSESLSEGVYGPLTPKQLSSLQLVTEAGRHLLDLINDILDLSKIEAGKMELRLGPVDVESVCQASLRMVRPPAMQKHLQIDLEIEIAQATVQADERRLKQMLVNLLSNAVKFTPEKGRVGLKVEVDQQAGWMRFVVWDTGIGIAPEKQSRLFQPFSQADSSLARQYGGTGLGLSLVRRLAELHGGEVGLSSEPGKGSRFYFQLPIPRATLESELVPGLGLQSALVVGDLTPETENIVRTLRDLGAEVVIDTQGRDVIARAAARPVQLVVLDLVLPERSGWDILADLQRDPRTNTIPVIVISVLDEHERGALQGAADVLVQPVSQEIFLQSLRQVMQEHTDPAVLASPTGDPDPSTRFPDAGRPLILLAEDNPISQETIQDLLEYKGYRVVMAANGIEAIATARECQPDLILMDVQMPVMDGLEAMQHLRAEARFAHTPIVALTALAMPGDRERCLAAGANGYLTKPFTHRNLLGLLDKLLPGVHPAPQPLPKSGTAPP